MGHPWDSASNYLPQMGESQKVSHSLLGNSPVGQYDGAAFAGGTKMNHSWVNSIYRRRLSPDCPDTTSAPSGALIDVGLDRSWEAAAKAWAFSIFLCLMVVLALVSPAHAATISRTLDGDTFKTTQGQTVRLLQIDAPELKGRECYGVQAALALAELLPPGSRVRLVTDPKLATTDRYGRLTRYVYRAKTFVNFALVAGGAATPWLYRGRGKFADELIRAAAWAKGEGFGLWGACPGTKLDPYKPADTGSR